MSSRRPSEHKGKDSTLLWNIKKYIPGDTALYLRRLECPSTHQFLQVTIHLMLVRQCKMMHIIQQLAQLWKTEAKPNDTYEWCAQLLVTLPHWISTSLKEEWLKKQNSSHFCLPLYINQILSSPTKPCSKVPFHFLSYAHKNINYNFYTNNMNFRKVPKITYYLFKEKYTQ